MILLTICAFVEFCALYFCVVSRHCVSSTIDIIHVSRLIELQRMNQGPLVKPLHFKCTCSCVVCVLFGVELRSKYHQKGLYTPPQIQSDSARTPLELLSDSAQTLLRLCSDWLAEALAKLMSVVLAES